MSRSTIFSILTHRSFTILVFLSLIAFLFPQLTYAQTTVDIKACNNTGNDTDFASLESNHNLNDTFLLQTNIDCNGVGVDPIGEVFQDTFTGHFDGQGNAIQNVEITDDAGQSDTVLAIFEANQGTIENLKVDGLTVDGSNQTGDNGLAGGLVALNEGTVDTVQLVVTDGDRIEGGGSGSPLTAGPHIGGFFGYQQNGGRIRWSSIEIQRDSGVLHPSASSEVGGLVGRVEDGGIARSSANGTGSVSGGERVGGVVGVHKGDTLSRTYSTVGVFGGDGRLGGLVGWVSGADDVRKNYSVGGVFANSAADSGGLIGNGRNSDGNNSFWDRRRSQRITSDGGNEVGLVSMEMIGDEAENGMSGLDFSNTWKTIEGSYPVLSFQNSNRAVQPILPVVEMTNPSDGAETSATKDIMVSGDITSDTLARAGDSVSVLVNGETEGAGVVQSDSTWSASNVNIDTGENTILARYFQGDTSVPSADTQSALVRGHDIAISTVEDSGGETLTDGDTTTGDTVLVKGHSDGSAAGDTVTVEVNPDGGSPDTFMTEVAGSGANDTYSVSVDLTPTDTNVLTARVHDTNSASSIVDQSDTFAVITESDGTNTPPSSDLVFPDTGAVVSDDVSGTFVLTDPDDNSGTATIEVSEDSGMSWNSAQLISTDTGSLDMDSNGETHPFTWDSTNLLSDQFDTEVKIRVRATDGDLTGGYDTSGAFTVDNVPPEIDTGTLQVTDTNDTLGLAELDGDSSLSEVQSHQISVSVIGADTVALHFRLDGIPADTNDTTVPLSSGTGDSWVGSIKSDSIADGDTLNFVLSSSDTATNSTVADSGNTGFEYRVQGPNSPFISITSPSSFHDTNVRPISVDGEAALVEEGDSVVVTVNDLPVDTVAIEADSSWVSDSVPLEKMGDSVVANLREDTPGSALLAQDTITVNFDNVAGTYPSGLTISDTGSDTVALGWTPFSVSPGSDPDSGVGFQNYVVIYDTNAVPDSSSTRWDTGMDSALSDTTTDTTIVSGLSVDDRPVFRIGYEDRLGNLSALSGSAATSLEVLDPADTRFVGVRNPTTEQPAVAGRDDTVPVRVVWRNSGERTGTVTVDTGELHILDQDKNMQDQFTLQFIGPGTSVSLGGGDTVAFLWSLNVPDNTETSLLGNFQLVYREFDNESPLNFAVQSSKGGDAEGGIDFWRGSIGQLNLVSGAGRNDGSSAHDPDKVPSDSGVILTLQKGDTDSVDTPLINPDYGLETREEYINAVTQADSEIQEGDTELLENSLLNIGIWGDRVDRNNKNTYIGDKSVLEEDVEVTLPNPVSSDSNVVVAKLTESGHDWKIVDSIPEIDSNKVQFEVSGGSEELAGFSVFRLLVVNVSDDGKASETIVYPNPFVPHDGRDETGKYGSGPGEGINFAAGVDKGFPAGTELAVYTITGEEVFSRTTRTGGIIRWNAQTRDGKPVASEVYIYRIKTPDGSEKVGKLSVVR